MMCVCACTCVCVPCLLLDVPVPRWPAWAVPGQSPRSRPITQAGGHASDICGTTLRNALQRPTCLSCWLPVQPILVDRYHLPAWTMSLCDHVGRAQHRHCRSTRFDVTVAPGYGHTAALCALSDRHRCCSCGCGLSPPTQFRAGGEGEDQDEEARTPLDQLAAPQLPSSPCHRPPMHHPVPPILQHPAIIRRSNSRTKPLLVCSDVMLPRLACRACMSGDLFAGGRAFRSGTN